jgi:hypothetical protein
MKGLTMTRHDSSADRAAADGAVRAVLDPLYAARAVGTAGAFRKLPAGSGLSQQSCREDQ